MSETQQTRSLADLKDLVTAATGTGVGTTEDGAPRREPKKDAQGRSYATGRRKSAIARVWLTPGEGNISINGKDFKA